MAGKGGSMHLTSVEHGVMGSYAIIGAHLTIANGAAWSAQYRGTGPGGGVLLRRRHDEHRRVPRGAQLRRGLQAAGGLRLREQPVHGVHADRRQSRPCRDPAADRAAAYGLEPIVVDGNDADAVYLTRAARASERARAAAGPSLIEALTYRHGGHSRADPGKYRPEAEVDAWMARTTRSPSTARGCSRSGVDEAELDRDREARSLARVDVATEEAIAGDRRRPGSAFDRRVGGRRFVMAQLTYRDAVARGIAQEMRRDERVVLPRRGRRRRRRRVQDHRRAARGVRPDAGASTPRSPSRRSSARRWARR